MPSAPITYPTVLMLRSSRKRQSLLFEVAFRQPYIVENFSGKNNATELQELLESEGITDKEDVYDPKSGKTIPSIAVGQHYTNKLKHQCQNIFCLPALSSIIWVVSEALNPSIAASPMKSHIRHIL